MKKVFCLIASFFIFTLLKMWLWIPLAFLLGVMAIAGGAGYWNHSLTRDILLIGSIILIAVALLGAAYSYSRRLLAEKTINKNVGRVQIYAYDKKEKNNYSERERHYDDTPHRSRYDEDSYRISCYEDDEYRHSSKRKRLYDEENNTHDRYKDNTKEELLSIDSNGRREKGFETQSKIVTRTIDNEDVRVFQTRKDPDILICEYPDRLVFYKKDPYGGEPQFLSEEYKGT